MSKPGQDEFSRSVRENQKCKNEEEEKMEIRNVSGEEKAKHAKHAKHALWRKHSHSKKAKLKTNHRSVDESIKIREEVVVMSKPVNKDTLQVDEPKSHLAEVKRAGPINQGIPKLGNIDTTKFLSVGGGGAYHGGCQPNTSKPKGGNQISPQGIIGNPAAKSTPAVNKAVSFDGADVPYQNLDVNPKVSLAVIGQTHSTASDDISDLPYPSDLLDPADESLYTRYDNNSSYIAAIRGGASHSLSESWIGALTTSCTSSIQGSNESLKYDNSQHDPDRTDERTLISTSSVSPKSFDRHESTSLYSGGNVIIPMITTNAPERDVSCSSGSSLSFSRKYNDRSKFSRQQSQPSPKDHRYVCRGIRRSISNRICSGEETTIRHVCSLGGIDSGEKKECCLKKYHCCSLHNCGGISTPNCGVKEIGNESGGLACNHLYVQNEPNLTFQCHHGHLQPNRICRNLACRETTTHIIGNGMCISQGTDSIAAIAADSLKFKGATKKFNQVKILEISFF